VSIDYSPMNGCGINVADRRFVTDGVSGGCSILRSAHFGAMLALLVAVSLAAAAAAGDQARPPVMSPPASGSDPESEPLSNDRDAAEGLRWIGCDCDSVFLATTIEIPWRSEAEALQRAAIECREAARETREQVNSWFSSAKRIRPSLPKKETDEVLRLLRRGSQEASKSSRGCEPMMAALASRLEAPHSSIPDPIRDALQRLARRDRSALQRSIAWVVFEPGGGGRVVGAAQPPRATSVKEAMAAMERSAEELLRREQMLDRLVGELTAIAVDGTELWGWSQAVGLERIPGVSGAVGSIGSASETRQWELESMLRYTCAMEAYVGQVPEWFARTGVGDLWMALVESALPSPVASKRRGFPDLRETFLDRLGSDGRLRAETQVRTIQENARKRIGRWLEGEMQRYGAIDDPALSARWTCLREFAGLLQEGKPLPKAPAEAPQKGVMP
jgi:hypothetical protein